MPPKSRASHTTKLSNRPDDSGRLKRSKSEDQLHGGNSQKFQKRQKINSIIEKHLNRFKLLQRQQNYPKLAVEVEKIQQAIIFRNHNIYTSASNIPMIFQEGDEKILEDVANLVERLVEKVVENTKIGLNFQKFKFPAFSKLPTAQLALKPRPQRKDEKEDQKNQGNQKLWRQNLPKMVRKAPRVKYLIPKLQNLYPADPEGSEVYKTKRVRFTVSRQRHLDRLNRRRRNFRHVKYFEYPSTSASGFHEASRLGRSESSAEEGSMDSDAPEEDSVDTTDSEDSPEDPEEAMESDASEEDACSSDPQISLYTLTNHLSEQWVKHAKDVFLEIPIENLIGQRVPEDLEIQIKGLIFYNKIDRFFEMNWREIRFPSPLDPRLLKFPWVHKREDHEDTIDLLRITFSETIPNYNLEFWEQENQCSFDRASKLFQNFGCPRKTLYEEFFEQSDEFFKLLEPIVSDLDRKMKIYHHHRSFSGILEILKRRIPVELTRVNQVDATMIYTAQISNPEVKFDVFKAARDLNKVYIDLEPIRKRCLPVSPALIGFHAVLFEKKVVVAMVREKRITVDAPLNQHPLPDIRTIEFHGTKCIGRIWIHEDKFLRIGLRTKKDSDGDWLMVEMDLERLKHQKAFEIVKTDLIRKSFGKLKRELEDVGGN
ncbi:hypothetical protein L3Y34_019575 [Caenorhabditis briggsae]|uniref:Uncharacterized protein n=1 Tax=Caenorhabditis briggsae TaxID=6238 RepID=A0AAE9IWW0_CAEBR|nr:hypothetical protein L3Y34_019575 [Caenorhabditis briggsae]